MFVARYVPPIYGLLASALLLVSDAYPYAYEARPYAIVAGLATLAFAIVAKCTNNATLAVDHCTRGEHRWRSLDALLRHSDSRCDRSWRTDSNVEPSGSFDGASGLHSLAVFCRLSSPFR